MSTIVIACDSFLALRNVRNAELGTKLKNEGHKVQVLVDPNQLAGSIAAEVPDVEVGPLLEFNPSSYPELQKQLDRMNWSRRSFKDPVTFLSKLEYRLANRRLFKYLSKPSLFFGWMVGAVGLYKFFQKRAAHELRKTSEYLEYKKILAQQKTILVAGFSPEGYREMVLLQVATDLHIPTIIMVRSRDNLVSKIAFLPEIDLYLVWSKQQLDYFRHLYPEYKKCLAKAIGSPQFCRHLDETFRLGRDDFFRQVKLDPNRKLVVLCLENPSVVPHQGNMATALAEAFESGRIGENAQLLIRNHPRAFGSDYDPLNGRKFNTVKVYPEPEAIPFGSHDSNIVKLILDDEPMHLATMAYQDVNVNIMSTVIIDSAVFDKPIINIGFDLPVDTPKTMTVKRFFKRTDFRIIEKTGATDIADSLDELVKLINNCISNPGGKSKERSALVREDIGDLNLESRNALLNIFLGCLDNCTALS